MATAQNIYYSKGHSKYLRAVRNQCIILYISGMQPREISVKMGVPRSCVSSCCKRAGVQMTRSQRAAWVKESGLFSGINSPAWRGGRYKNEYGYIVVYQGVGKRIGEHTLIAEKVLGRKLKKWELVHHINGIKDDNRYCNLLICDKSYHAWLHHKMARLYQQEHFTQ
jgi:hypothetical protein